MKRSILLFSVAILAIASCKKNDDNPDNSSSCGTPDWSEELSTRSVSNPCGLAISDDGKVAVSAYNGGYGLPGNVYIYKSLDALMSNAGGSPSVTYTAAKAPEALAFDHEGHLFIAETEATAGVTIIDAKGVKLKTIQSGFNNPRGMAIDDKGRLYLADDGNNRVLRFDSPVSSNGFSVAISGLSSPKGLAISGNDLYVAEYGANRVRRYDLNDMSGPKEAASVTQPVDVAANGCFVAISSPGSKKITLKAHGNLGGGDVIVYNLNYQTFGMLFLSNDAGMLITAYEYSHVAKLKP